MSSGRIAVLDMAGTTVADGDTVENAFAAAMSAVGRGPGTARWDDDLSYVRATMGQSKIEVFRQLCASAPDPEVLAQQANSAFEDAYAASVRGGEVAPMPGAAEVIADLRFAGARVALTTGFAPPTRDAILAALGWTGLADLVLSPADAGRGRPYPDMIWTALLRLGGAGVGGLCVCGDTGSDIDSGVRAGARWRVGVLSGAGREIELRRAGATHVVSDITCLPAVFESDSAHPYAADSSATG